jgi:hypothetical protein
MPRAKYLRVASIRFAEELTQDPSQALAEGHYLVAEAKKLLTGNAPCCF